MQYPKRLIEVDLPIKRISAHSRREKSIRHGHISTLHIWWARRPLAACRAVLCASMWPDPADPLCPAEFVVFAQEEMIKWCDRNHLVLLSKESIENFIKVSNNRNLIENKTYLRTLLLDFIADFANWDNSNNKEFLDSARALTKSSHIALGGDPDSNPLVADPFAGGGSIPLESLRVGADCFASDLNPIPYLINKIQLEFIPKFGKKLSSDLRKIGSQIKIELEKELGHLYYDINEEEDKPLAFIWARAIRCEGPGCGLKVPLIRNLWISKKRNKSFALSLEYNNSKEISVSVLTNPKASYVKEGTCKRGALVCPNCGFTTSVHSTRKQLNENDGGIESSILLYTVHYDKDTKGKTYKSITNNQYQKYTTAKEWLFDILNKNPHLLPNETLPLMSGVFNVPLYGHHTWGSLFNSRQALALIKLTSFIKNGDIERIISTKDEEYLVALKTCFAFVIDRCADYWSTLAIWSGDFVAHTFGRQALGIVWDYCEANPFTDSSGNFQGAVNWICRVIEDIGSINSSGSITQASATQHPLGDDSVDYLFTDPPYYNAVPYADLSDYFYVWLKRSIGELYKNLFNDNLAPKELELCEMAGWDSQRYAVKDAAWYESQMNLAMLEARRISKPNSIGIVVFAHKSTQGWEAQLKAMIDAGWIFTGSWPIDTERPGRLRANNSAALASSVHLVCRPRENPDGSLILDQIGDWRDVQQELPKRIHDWMPRLAAEGVAGADAIFACLGPALEVFSRYTRVEKPNGDIVSLREYLEKVWAAVSQEALNMVFTGGEAQALEEDARLTAMWLWTLSAGIADSSVEDDDQTEKTDDDENSGGSKLLGGFTLEYDTARKIAQGLGANLDELKTLVEIKGDKARLLPVIERTEKLFGATGMSQQPLKKKKKVQLSLSFESEDTEPEVKFDMPELKVEQTGKTVLDRLHQAMLLFSNGRTEALKRFLVDDGAGKDDRFWKLAQSLTSLYPRDSDERRWVEAVQTYKKSLGF